MNLFHNIPATPYKHIHTVTNPANLITRGRMLFSFLLLLFPPFSAPFIVIYLLCGISDAVDGAIARRTGCACEAGAKLDSIADLLFTAACLIKLLPSMSIKIWLWIFMAGIAVIKTVNLILGYLYCGAFVSVHSFAAKLTGLLLFALLPFVNQLNANIASIPVCITALWAAVQESLYVLRKQASQT